MAVVFRLRQPDHGPGVHEPAWRETKTAVLLRMKRQVSDVDPQPNLPTCFAGPLGSAVELPPASESATPAEKPDWRPVPVVRSGLATLNDSETFGWMAAAAADRRGFFTATAKAFVSDGLPYNWSIQRRHFADFEPILDFVHAAEHVHAAAKATGQGVELGRHWAESCWEGRVGDVLGEIADHQSRIDPPTNPKTTPTIPGACSIASAATENNQSRMDYPRYRRVGLPITSSPVESWVKQLNQAPKGARNSGTTTPTPRPCSTSARLGSTTTRNSSTRFATGQVIPTRGQVATRKHPSLREKSLAFLHPDDRALILLPVHRIILLENCRPTGREAPGRDATGQEGRHVLRHRAGLRLRAGGRRAAVAGLRRTVVHGGCPPDRHGRDRMERAVGPRGEYSPATPASASSISTA